MPHPHVPSEPPARDAALNRAPPPARQTSSSQVVRPTPRFAPSWSRQHQQHQRSLTAMSQRQRPSALPQSQPSMSARRFVMNTGSSNSNATGGRWKHTPQQRRHTEKADDAIEEGSSPLRDAQDVRDVETASVTEAEADSGESMQLPRTSLPQVPLSLARPTQWDYRRRRSPRPREEIEEAKSSSVVGEDSTDGCETEGRESDANLAASQEHEVHTPNSYSEQQDRSHTDIRAHTASAATRLFSVAQPFKRRRLFESPRLIASSPSAAFSDEEEEERESDCSSIFDETVNAELLEEHERYDDMKDVSSSGELLEDEEHEHHDYDEDDDDDIFSYHRWPKRQSRLRGKVGTEQQRIQQDPFQRARLFLHQIPGHRLGDDEDEAGFGIGADHMDAEAPQWHDWAGDEQQPPDDLFSPAKRTRRRRRRRPRNEAAAKLLAAGGVDEQFVPGGLAAELRDWLVQIKNSRDVQSTGKLRATVDHVSAASGIGMCLVQGHWREPGEAAIAPCATGNAEAGQNSIPPCHLLLVGDGRKEQEGRMALADTVRGGRAVVGDIVELAPPLWEIDIDGKTWTVVSDWGSLRERAAE